MTDFDGIPDISDFVKLAGNTIPNPTCDLPDEQRKYDAMYLGIEPKVVTDPERCHDLELLASFHVEAWPRRILCPVLVAGAGPGLAVRKMLSWGFDAYACDISQVLMYYYLDMPQRFSCCPLHRTTYAAKWFGLTVCSDVLEHIPEDRIEDSLRELARVTKHVLMIAVATAPSAGITGMHQTVHDQKWWSETIGKYGHIYIEGNGERHASFIAEVK